MTHHLTLPSLQASLDKLPVAHSLALASNDIERLFGFNDVGTASLRRFARGYNCVAAHTHSCVVFHKLPLHYRGSGNLGSEA